MEFINEFPVGLPVEQAWALFTDVERIAPCMPGTQLTEVNGDKYHGAVKIKVGPVVTQFKGVASFEKLDAVNKTAVLRAEGRDVKGQGNASGLITMRLHPDGQGTRVTVETQLSVTGKVAQFGKGVMEDISKKLLAQFVTSLEAQLAAEQQPSPALHSVPGGTDRAEPEPEAAPGPHRRIESAEAEPLDLMGVARGAVLKRALPPAAVLVVLAAVIFWLTR
jgi:carbon monoxide dehydrogenase subunit G